MGGTGNATTQTTRTNSAATRHPGTNALDSRTSRTRAITVHGNSQVHADLGEELGCRVADNPGNTVDRMPPLPVTVLTGFLGAGKTTLLARLLREPHQAGIAL